MTSNLLGPDALRPPPHPPPPLRRAAGQALPVSSAQAASLTFPTPAAGLADLANDISRRFNAEKQQQMHLLRKQQEELRLRRQQQEQEQNWQTQQQQLLLQMHPPAKRQRVESSRAGLADAVSYIGTLGSDQRKPEPKGAAASSSPSPAPAARQDASKLSLFPPRPKSMSHKRRMGGAGRAQAPTKKAEVSTKPYTIEPPRRAPQLPNGATVDYYPWKGRLAEDTLNEQSIRQGHYDKTMVSQNETGSARSIILGGVRHKNGLQALSRLFVATLQQRQDVSAVTAKNTFKLPPRVTLTDTKREAWLRDLADSAIPLRRLSRSIPHGIRGKSLLEQCLTKKIPTSRAIWLTKCVGANEIRAFKRKGTSGAFVSGGEAKWVKDWTLSLNQFIDSLIDACGSPEWKDNITYGLQLVAHIYSEKLLDQDAFLDGIITGVQGATAKDLTAWMLALRCFFKDVRLRRRRARKLVVALADQVVKVQKVPAAGKWGELLNRPAELLRMLMTSQPDCLLLPDCWEAYEDVIQKCGDEAKSETCFFKIRARNHRACRQRLESESLGGLSGPQRLISLLDVAGSHFDFGKLSKQCRGAVVDDAVLVSTVLEWASTRFRSGPARIYLAVRLLRHWARHEVDLDKHLIAFLNDGSAVARILHPPVYRMVAELVRSRQFSIGRYIQTLMARGSSTGESNPHVRFQLELLRNIPLHGLPDHVLNLREIVLGNITAVRSAKYNLDVAKAYCLKQAPCLADKEKRPLVPANFDLSQLDGSTHLELARWIRQVVAVYVSDSSESDDMSIDGEDSKISNLPPHEFDAICDILIGFEDYSILADVLGMVTETCDVSLLSSVCCILVRGFDCFYAIGAIVDLVQKYFGRFGDVRGRSLLERPLFSGILGLVKRLGLPKTSKGLELELASCEPTAALAACSPVSDQMAEALQNSDANFIEEVENLIKSGTSMDRGVMHRVFRDIVKKVEACWFDNHQMMSAMFEVMAKIAPFNKAIFNGLVVDWLSSVLAGGKWPRLPHVLVPLVCNDILTLQDVVTCVVALVKSPLKHERLVAEMYETVQYSDRFAWDPPTPTSERFVDSQRSLIKHGSGLVLKLIGAALQVSAKGSKDMAARINGFLDDSSFQALVLGMLTAGPPSLRIDTANMLASNHRALLSVDTALSLGPLDRTPFDNLCAIFRVADNFNMDLCTLRLAMVMRDTPAARDDAERLKLGHRLAQELAPGYSRRPQAWGRLLRELPAPIAARALAITTHILLRQVNDPARTASASPSKEDLLALVSALLLHPHPLEEDNPPMLEAFAAALNQQRAALKAIPLNQAAPDSGRLHFDGPARAARVDAVVKDAAALVELVAAHFRSLASARATPAVLTRLALALAYLFLEPGVARHADFAELAFDVLQCVHDAMPAEARAHAAHVLSATAAGPGKARLDFLFGPSEADLDNHWVLVQDPQSRASVPDARAAAGPSAGSSSAAIPRGWAPAPPSSADVPRAAPVAVPFALRRWEMVPDATPVVGPNDASLSLTLFGASKAVF